MSELTPLFSSGDSNGVRGRYIDIALASNDELATRLEYARQSPIRLIDTAFEENCALPLPIEGVVFDAWQPPEGESVPHLNATIDLSIEEINDFSDEAPNPWNITYMNRLELILRSQRQVIDRIAHDIDTLHVRLDQNYAASIKIISSLQACEIELSLELIDELENALGVMSEFPPDESSDSVTVMRRFATALSAALDATLETFGKPLSVDTRHLLDLTPAPVEYAKTKLASTALALIEAEIPIPEYDQLPERKGLDTLAGLFGAKSRLKEIAEDYGDTEAAYLYDITPTHFILYGPPGTGKTSLAKAFADDIGAACVIIPTTKIHGKFVGDSAKNLEEVFMAAFEKQSPQVIFFDEFETLGLANQNGSNHVEAKKRLQQLILETTADHPEIVIAAAMNADKDDIEPALLRSGRLEPIAVGLPQHAERVDILSELLIDSRSLDIELKNLELEMGTADDAFILYDQSIDCIELAEKSDGFSIADLVSSLEIARRAAYRRYKQSGTLSTVTHQDILASFDRLQRR